MSLGLFDLAGRTALVTGSSSGIGLAVARGLAAAGARVAIHGREPGRVEAALAEVPGAVAVRFDVADEAGVAAGVAAAEAALGRIDILVNNAGMQRRGPLDGFALADWNLMLATHLTGAFLVARAAVPGMAANGGGKIINVCSLTSEVARRSIAPYTAAKGGLKQLTRAMAVEWAEHNIQVNGIGPGYFRTKLNADLAEDPEFDRWVRARTPAGRWGRLDELVGPALFLASDASSFVTGQILYVDGGILASI
jgi:gluconate 5-dehydrogenase